MVIRSYRSEDCPQMARLFHDTVHHICAQDYTEEQLRAWSPGEVDLTLWDASFRAHCTMVAEEDGRILGFGDMDSSGHLDRLYVHKDSQGRGIATAICHRLEQEVPVNRYTVHASITARPFFAFLGYRVICPQQVERHGVKLTNYQMEKVTTTAEALFCRPMTGADLPGVVSLYMDYYNIVEGGAWTWETTYKRIHQVLSRKDALCLLLMDRREILGFAMGYFEQYDDISAYDLVEIVIAHGHQNKGLGSAFMTRIEDEVKRRGGAMIQLQAVNDEAHRRFYDRLGYKNCTNLVLKSKWLEEENDHG